MHKVFILSIQHTGTYFASFMTSSGFNKEEKLRIGSLYEAHRKLKHKQYITTTPIELSDFVKPTPTIKKDWFDRAILSVCTEEQLKDKKIVVGHEHHHKAGSWLIKALAKAPSETSIVIPMRDPILSLHSKIWREIEQHHNAAGIKEKARKNRLDSWIVRYKEILSLPKGHVFILPIDAEQSKTEESRLKIIKELHDYCNINFNQKAQEAAKQWLPDNRTFNLVSRTQKVIPDPKWEQFKVRYAERDIKHTRAVMGLEFERLHRDEELKRLMENIGYKDVLWW